MESYDTTRQRYRPESIKFLLIAESPPPAASVQSSRQFYRSEKVRVDDRLFTNTIRALYPETLDQPEPELEAQKEKWLRKFQADGFYMIEALQTSLKHEVTKPGRQALIAKQLPALIKLVTSLAQKNTKLILIKSNVFEVATEPLRKAGFTVLNTELVDYPGHYNQRAYREKLARLVNPSELRV